MNENIKIPLLKVKEEVKDEDELVVSSLLSFEGDSEVIKQEYHCKEEVHFEWDEKDNNYVDNESKFNQISHEAIVKSEADDGVQIVHPNVRKTHKPSKKPNALPKLIKRCCPKCDNLTDITKSFLYTKDKCAKCSTISLLFQCAKCCKRYSHYDSVRYHVLTKCNPDDEDYHECPDCSYKTTIQSQLAKHVKRVHHEKKNDRVKLLTCKICGKEFKYTYSLNRHAKKSCGLKFPKCFVECDCCDKKFKNEDYLKEHRKVCRREIRFVCDHCGYESKHKRRLILHLKKKHPHGKSFDKS